MDLQRRRWWGWLVIALSLLTAPGLLAQTHPAMRPLPTAAPADRTLPDGPLFYVDGPRGSDAAAGTKVEPWRTVQHGIDQLRPGDTLVVREGIYYESLTVAERQGSADLPITITGHPGELVVIDAGHREFLEDPAASWEPCPDGPEGLYRSTALYPDLAGDTATMRGLRFVVGHFADTMNPLQIYKWKEDLETDFPYLRSIQRVDTPLHMGPGFWVDPDTGRVYVRLAHMPEEVWGEFAYRGPTDPREVPMVVGGVESPLQIEDSGHLHVRDLVLRGSRNRNLNVRTSNDLVFDGLTVHSGGVLTVSFINTSRVSIRNCVVRGASTPWSNRITHKFRGSYPSMFNATNSSDFEIVDSEFTDSYGGFRGMGRIEGVRFERNLVDNFCYITFELTPGQPHGRELVIARNLIRRCFTVFLSTEEHSLDEVPVLIVRNVIDLREPLWWTPREGDEEMPNLFSGHLWHETRDYQNRPIARTMHWIHNTVLFREGPANGAYGGLSRPGGGGMPLAFHNNIFAYSQGDPAVDHLSHPAGGNLHWAYAPSEDWDARAENQERSQSADIDAILFGDDGQDGPSWPVTDVIADPRFRKLEPDLSAPIDLRLRSDSPAVGKAVAVPGWEDPLFPEGSGSTTIGALPQEIDEPWTIGPHGRWTVFGEVAGNTAPSEE